jgi:hypothetical protein
MKTLHITKDQMIAAIATILVVAFVVAAVIHIVSLTNMGLINWRD